MLTEFHDHLESTANETFWVIYCFHSNIASSYFSLSGGVASLYSGILEYTPPFPPPSTPKELRRARTAACLPGPPSLLPHPQGPVITTLAHICTPHSPLKPDLYLYPASAQHP
ncbi:hypothetical protein N7G274_002961 [Stereocaulon virgatum]|uniref:Uncharacterized protein n=1 Tax=Stereocaulon virgatum TaxID=373712 RepID=A0ABR4AHC7_9LECA